MTEASYADRLWALVFADDPDVIGRLEIELETSRLAAVDGLIERSCWSEDLPQLVGGKGSTAERLAALRAAHRQQKKP